MGTANRPSGFLERHSSLWFGVIVALLPIINRANDTINANNPHFPNFGILSVAVVGGWLTENLLERSVIHTKVAFATRSEGIRMRKVGNNSRFSLELSFRQDFLNWEGFSFLLGEETLEDSEHDCYQKVFLFNLYSPVGW